MQPRRKQVSPNPNLRVRIYLKLLHLSDTRQCIWQRSTWSSRENNCQEISLCAGPDEASGGDASDQTAGSEYDGQYLGIISHTHTHTHARARAHTHTDINGPQPRTHTRMFTGLHGRGHESKDPRVRHGRCGSACGVPLLPPPRPDKSCYLVER